MIVVSATKTSCFYLLLIACLFHFTAGAQQCGNCKLTPSVAGFDLDVQVDQLADTGELMFQWKQLFWLGKHANNYLFQNNKNCVRFTQPPSATGNKDITIEGVELEPLKEEDEILILGETYTNLAPAGSLSRFGNYIITGYVKQQGNDYVMHMEVQSACGRKTVVAADIPFQISSLPGQTIAIAQQAASMLSPLIDKIKTFEQEERKNDKALSLYQSSWGEPIKITPQKTTLKAGESTEITIELKDCDGIPLEGREILFTQTSFEGLDIQGTTGGSVTPAKVITGAGGKAIARFTLASGAKEAVINAHSPGNEVKGCGSMFIGNAGINIRRTYSGYVKYSYANSSNCFQTGTSGCLKSTFKGTQEDGVQYTAVFFDDSPKIGNATQFTGEDENQTSNGVPKMMESGSYNQRKFEIRDGEIVCASVSKGAHNVQRIQFVSEGKLKYGSFNFSFDPGGTAALSVHMVFKTKDVGSFEQTHLQSAKNSTEGEISWDFSFIEGFDKDFTFKKQTSGGKTKYTLSGTRTLTGSCSQNSSETIHVVVTEE